VDAVAFSTSIVADFNQVSSHSDTVILSGATKVPCSLWCLIRAYSERASFLVP